MHIIFLLRKWEVKLTMNSSKFIRFAGFIGVIAPILGLSGVFVSTLLAGEGFSWSRNALSDLGVSQAAGIFNYSLILVGMLNLVFTIGFVSAYAANTLFYVGGILLTLGGASLSLVGVFTENHGVLHSFVSLGYFVLFPIAMILLGFAFVKVNKNVWGYLSMSAGAGTLFVILSALVFRWYALLNLGFAVPEIVEAVILAVWIGWMGIGLIRLK
jgi:hypothetical membrane protein